MRYVVRDVSDDTYYAGSIFWLSRQSALLFDNEQDARTFLAEMCDGGEYEVLPVADTETTQEEA